MTANLASDSLTSKSNQPIHLPSATFLSHLTTHPQKPRPPHLHRGFDLYQILYSTITVCQSAQCQRRELPPHPNPPRNPPPVKIPQIRNLISSIRKSLESEFLVSVSEASYGLGSEYKRSCLRKPIHHSRQTKQTQKISRFSFNNIHSKQKSIFHINIIYY